VRNTFLVSTSFAGYKCDTSKGRSPAKACPENTVNHRELPSGVSGEWVKILLFYLFYSIRSEIDGLTIYTCMNLICREILVAITAFAPHLATHISACHWILLYQS
jgi:hypothetical protein